MTLENIEQISIQVVADMGYIKGQQINTVFIIDRMPDIRQDSLGATYKDFLDGRFWSREWVKTGANPTNLKAQWPILIIERQPIQIECMDSQDMTQTLAFLIIDQIGCDNCPQDDRTGAQVSDSTLQMLRQFFLEAYSYQLCEVDRSPDPNTFEWLSEGRQDYYATQGLTIQATFEDYASFVNPNPIEVTEWGESDDIRGHFANIEFNICKSIPQNFNYNQATIDKLATTVCPC